MGFLVDNGKSMEGKNVLISGSGNVAQYAAVKVLELGGNVLSMSDSNGTLICADGFTKSDVEAVMHLKNVKRGRCKELASERITFHEGKRPWGLVEKVDVALPCATQNEIETDDANALVKAGCSAVFEGANMPSTPDAIKIYKEKSIAYIGVLKT